MVETAVDGTTRLTSSSGVMAVGLSLVVVGESLHLGLSSYVLGSLYVIGALRLAAVLVLGFYAIASHSSIARWILAVLTTVWAGGYILGGLARGGVDAIVVGIIVLAGSITLMTSPVSRYLRKPEAQK